MKSYSFSIIIPVYNEEQHLEKQLEKLRLALNKVQPLAEYEILLVENGSSDNTYKIARNIAKKHNQIRIFHLDNPSYGLAFKEGLLQAKYDTVFQFDIDFWDADFLDISLLLLTRYDLVIGSKNLGNSDDGRPFYRRFLSRLLERFLKIYFGIPYTDTHGMKALKRNAIMPLLDHIVSENHFFDSEMLIRSYFQGYSYKELPVNLEEIRSTRFPFLIRLIEVVKEFGKLVELKRTLTRYAYL